MTNDDEYLEGVVRLALGILKKQYIGQVQQDEHALAEHCIHLVGQIKGLRSKKIDAERRNRFAAAALTGLVDIAEGRYSYIDQAVTAKMIADEMIKVLDQEEPA